MKLLRTITIAFALLAVPGLALADQGDRKAHKQQKLDEFDRNKDGKLDDAERATMHEAMIDRRFDKMDTDGNGSISRAELAAHMKAKGFGKHKGKHKAKGKQAKGKQVKGKQAKGKPALKRKAKAKVPVKTV
jgi:hypothetical protein